MSSPSRLYCHIRKEWTAALPEEYVRQYILHTMIEKQGFPRALIAVEKSLHQMPHLAGSDYSQIPDRRADIVCYAKDIHPSVPLYPLLIVECKGEVQLSPRVINQVVGYNHFVKACFIAVANHSELRLGWYEQQVGNYTFINYLPTYSELVASIKK